MLNPGLRPLAAFAAVFLWTAARLPAVELSDSLNPVRPHVARESLSAAEAAETLTIELPLRLRHRGELQTRIARGDVLRPEELSARYLPAATDVARVAAWARAQGLAVDPGHHVLSVFASAPVSQLSQTFGVRFARVTARGREVTAAISAPQVPEELANLILGVNGLEQHRAEMVHFNVPGGSAPYKPSQVLAAYNGSATGLAGTGQTIAIIAGTYPLASDLTAFWSGPGVTRTAPLPVNVPVNGGPPQGVASGESSLDAEWAGAIAPDAKLRIYGVNMLNTVTIDQACSQIYSDASNDATLRVVSMSFGAPENSDSPANLQSSSQYFLMLSALGVSCFAASGDSGSQPGMVGQGVPVNDPDFPTGVSYPSCDPNVTSVGGTTLNLTTAGAVQTETAWSSGGGGQSNVFTRGAWQTAPGMPTGTKRAVPDVAALGDPAAGASIAYQAGFSSSAGTSLSCPVWAGIGALINQARLANGQTTLGAVAPKLYALAGTAAFWDITLGSNGVFAATPGFDLCTGLGVPNIAQLVAALAGTAPAATAPVVLSRPGAQQVVAAAGAQLTVTAIGAPPLTYAWQRRPAGAATWTTLTNGGSFSAVQTAALGIGPVSAAMSGDAFRCQVANASGSVTTGAIELAVEQPAVVSTFAGKANAAGYVDGVGAAARFSGPFGIAVDGAGNLFVSDTGNQVIRQIAPDGTVSTIAGGPGAVGATDGPGATARFNRPSNVAFDAAGNLYVSDTGNNTIRLITPAHVVSTFAGTAGTVGATDGTGAAARFSGPRGLAFDSAGNLYVADAQNATVRRISPAGVVSTFAGQAGAPGTADGPAGTGQFSGPRGLAFDAYGYLYVADATGGALRRVGPDGSVTTIAGTSGYTGSQSGAADISRLSSPYAVATDAAGNVYVADNLNSAIQVLAPNGVLSSVAGLPGSPGFADGLGIGARFNVPLGLAADASGNLYVVDSTGNTIRKLALLPSVYQAPLNQTVTVGSSLTLTVAATGAALSYQWQLNGVALSGATGSSLVLSNVQPANAGQYTVVVRNASGSTTSAAGTVTVVAAASSPNIHLVNLSTRANSGLGAAILDVGFSAVGPASATKTLLMRGVGPTLAQFGVSGVMAAPGLIYYNAAGAPTASNSAWGTPSYPGAATAAQLQAAFTSTYAFSLPSGSLDAAILQTVSQGTGTLSLSGLNDTTGVALAEIYDTDTSPAPAVLLENLSARAVAGSGAGNGLTAGFVLSGTGRETLLIRGIGPTLGAFGVSGALSSVSLTLFDSGGQVIATNVGWSNLVAGGSSAVAAEVQPATPSVMSAVGAFGLTAGSADSAMVVTLPSGAYTAGANGVAGASGVALVEIYQVSTQ